MLEVVDNSEQERARAQLLRFVEGLDPAALVLVYAAFVAERPNCYRYAAGKLRGLPPQIFTAAQEVLTEHEEFSRLFPGMLEALERLKGDCSR